MDKKLFIAVSEYGHVYCRWGQNRSKPHSTNWTYDSFGRNVVVGPIDKDSFKGFVNICDNVRVLRLDPGGVKSIKAKSYRNDWFYVGRYEEANYVDRGKGGSQEQPQTKKAKPVRKRTAKPKPEKVTLMELLKEIA